ncbi:DME family drug/metabolite transporter [Nocardia transvalensis]|uniref:DME family drug/metabolite transporter n=1 Tax=Nocardia transvalensis TaxID=37333 RepID=A0A7W9UHD9_9NOCA|nr:EamA family transporter [Nocardia transvalensis]MBB5913022.1 DME family drug/metabolite transporter [Nocardia transvalensis]
MSVDLVATRDRSAAALIAAGILWGTGGLAGSLLASHAQLHPLSVATYRLLLGGGLAVALLAVSGGLRALPRTRAAGARILLTGGLLGCYQASYFIAVHYISVSLATMVTIGALPVFVAAGAAVRDRARPERTTLLAIGIALLGLALLTWSPGGRIGGWELAAGVACSLFAAAGFAAMTLVTATPVAGLDPLRTTAFGMLTGGLLLTPAALAFGMALPLRPGVLLTAAYLGSAPTAVAYTAYFRGLRTAAPVFAALAALLEPLTAALLAAVVLGDRLGAQGWCGAALLIAALAISSRR